MTKALSLAFSGQTIRQSFRISLVVGTALNLINQWESLRSGQGIIVGHLLLNYMVPYCVATYSAVQVKLQRPVGDPANGKDNHDVS